MCDAHTSLVRFFLSFIICLVCITPATAQDNGTNDNMIGPVHGLAMHGQPKYSPDFDHLEYVNPDAPKGGTLRMAAVGSFDSLNPFILKGIPAGAMNLVFETLLENTDDEAFTEYGLIAESIEMPIDRSAVIFNLREEARWHDGQPITAEDVVWSFNALIEHGNPFYRAYYGNVEKAEAINAHRVKFSFDIAGNMELPLIMGQMPVLPKHYWTTKDRKFEETTLTPPLGSGAYKVKSVDPGRKIVLERMKDWWGKDLPINRGRYNYDEIAVDYYRDDNVALEALFGGDYDFRRENTAKTWATAYDARPVKEGKIVKDTIEHSLPSGMQGYVFNTRRDIFKDPKVRHALAHAFDFEWSNKQFAYGSYTRTNSYFDNSELASSGLPSGREREILGPYRDRLPEEIFTQQYKAPSTDGSGNNRKNLRTGMTLLEEAGWILGEDKIRVHKDTGKRLEFEILDNNPAFERWTLPFIKNLERLGVKASFRIVDSTQYKNRLDNFDFDMTIAVFGQSNSPGNEQRDFWGSEKADVKGSRNIIGIKNPVIDDLIEMIIKAPTREELIQRTRALDRVLLWHHYVIPQWHIGYFRLAYWNKFGRPDITPKYGLGIVDTWWVKDAAAKAE